VRVIVAGRAAIAATSVEMAEQFAGLANGIALELLLDVHVERIKMEFEHGAANIMDHLEGLLARIDEIGFEAVEGFHADLPPAFFRILAKLLEILHDGLPLLF